MNQQKQRSVISDKLVLKKTGKDLESWFIILDKQGAKQMNHAAIFELTSTIKGLEPLSAWCQNLLTTTYEWNRGIKERGHKAVGFEISVSKTIAVNISKLYQAWIDDRTRIKWLGKEKIVIRKATENKSARLTWVRDETSLSIEFYEKAENKSQVVVQHQKIPDSEKAALLKTFWGDRLKMLKIILES